MKKLTTVTVGIPAFNEAGNIISLINDLLNQKQTNYKLRSIVVISDGSNDATDDLVKKLKSKKINLIKNLRRQGKANSLNKIVKKSTSDILVLLDADILISDSQFISKLIKPLIKKTAAITYAKVKEAESKNLFSSILLASMEFKRNIFENWNDGDNIYTAVGRARAITKSLYKKLFFKTSISEDSYTYLFAKTGNYRYQYVRDAVVTYQLPNNFSDHTKQSVRFEHSKIANAKEFNPQLVSQLYKIPPHLYISSFIKSVFTSPLLMVYFLIQLPALINGKTKAMTSDTWSIANSSK